MLYTIKCLVGIHSKDDFKIKAGQELEVSKEIYDYFNNAYGASGKFNFATKETPKKAPAPKKEEVKKVVKEVKKSED